MRTIVVSTILLAVLPLLQPAKDLSAATVSLPVKDSVNKQPAPNLIIITVDGFRWQELFTGVDPSLINNTQYTPDTATMKMLYWSDSEKERRQKLMPFLWSILAKKGQLYGNRQEGNKVNTANIYNFSYPGYNEILTGNTDLLVASNKRKLNSNTNVLEYLNTKEAFKGKVVAFTSWDVFPYILNEERSGMLVNSGYESMGNANISDKQQLIDKVQAEAVYNKGGTRHDQLTFLTAKEYLQQHRPRVLFLGLGETDEYAHSRRYDLYLEQANKIDRMLAELWHWIQTTPGYKDNTTILITTDHGRGSRRDKWSSHSSFIRGSSQTWLALLGPSIEPLGEVKDNQQLYQQQIAGLIAELVGEKFRDNASDLAIVSKRR
ncbi:alkaline phosphatase family protein [Terrimonas pollutisoli]|uniref:alkaline phosphatase family protein n=1 Tax=Terrimonas pollutisoli TaxID=3034147 RepID=UPI0023EC9D55|nr:alkaline phosphatase family protein [Terrimonas sp. H1YJ31]